MTTEEFKNIREGMGLTQSGLAPILGVSRKAINEMERGVTSIDRRTAITLRTESERMKLISLSYTVGEAINGKYQVVQHLMRQLPRPAAMFHANGSTMLFGEFERRDHAYRWCAALRLSPDARNTRKLLRSRAEEVAARQAA